MGIGWANLGWAVAPLILLYATAGHAAEPNFEQKWQWMLRRDPQPGIASVYWEDEFDARGKRFRPDKISCAHRFEPFNTDLVVTNLENGKKIICPVLDRGPFKDGRVLDLSRGAAKALGCDGLCPVDVKRKGFE